MGQVSLLIRKRKWPDAFRLFFLVVVIIAVLMRDIRSVAGDRGSFPAPSSTNAAFRFLQKSVPNGLLRATPAFDKRRTVTSSSSSAPPYLLESVEDVSSTTTTIRPTIEDKKRKNRPNRIRKNVGKIRHVNNNVAKRVSNSVGFYYGLTPSVAVHDYKAAATDKGSALPAKKRLALRDTMAETLDELRIMRQEMEILRRELQAMKRQLIGESDQEAPAAPEESVDMLMARRKRAREFDKLAHEVEKWAQELLFKQEGEVDGWTEVPCHRAVKASVNGRTRIYLKWMKDSRGTHARPDDNREYPCLRMYSTIDAPLEHVCTYLASEERSLEYNDLLSVHKDLEELTPHSKICFGQTPSLLFIKPRELVTFCHHRWLRDGTEVVVNQACDEYKGTNPTAFALRGATYIKRDPDNPGKTLICMLSHANPGSDVPTWACKTAVNAVAPIEPFKLFMRINDGVKRWRPEPNLQETELVGVSGRSPRPAGLSQLGYCCFWPKGGGMVEGAAATGDESSIHTEDSSSVELSESLSPPPARELVTVEDSEDSF